MLGSENWEDNCEALLHLVKELIVVVWEVQNIYGVYTVMTHIPGSISVSCLGWRS